MQILSEVLLCCRNVKERGLSAFVAPNVDTLKILSELVREFVEFIYSRLVDSSRHDEQVR